jgi:hypothetical protein
MTDKPSKSRPQRLRSFVAFPLPFVLFMTIALAFPGIVAEPDFVRSWSVEAKALAMFAAIAAIITATPVVFDLWARRIDPTGYGARHRKPLETFLDNLPVNAACAAVIPYAIYGKQLQHIPVWWIALAVAVFCLLPLFLSIYLAMTRGGRS